MHKLPMNIAAKLDQIDIMTSKTLCFFDAICSEVWQNALLLCSEANSIIVEVMAMPPMALLRAVGLRS
jgi:hypothetical protein